MINDSREPIFCAQPQHAGHSFGNFFGRAREGVFLNSRRSMLKASMAGIAGLSLPSLLQVQAQASAAGQSLPTGKSVILLWMAGGPSHIDTWDSKPDRPWVNRGPFGVTRTKLPGAIRTISGQSLQSRNSRAGVDPDADCAGSPASTDNRTATTTRMLAILAWPLKSGQQAVWRPALTPDMQVTELKPCLGAVERCAA